MFVTNFFSLPYQLDCNACNERVKGMKSCDNKVCWRVISIYFGGGSDRLSMETELHKVKVGPCREQRFAS